MELSWSSELNSPDPGTSLALCFKAGIGNNDLQQNDFMHDNI